MAPRRCRNWCRLVASELVSEVCSIYVLRPGDILELAATEGLKLEAVGRTRLRVGEGIIGLVAATGAGAQPAGCAEPSGLRLPPGDRRGAVRLAAGGAGAPRRPHAGRARGAEPRAAPLRRGRGGGAGDGGDAAGRDAGRQRRDRWRRGRAGRHGAAPLRRHALVSGIAIGPVVLHGAMHAAAPRCWPTIRPRSWRGWPRRGDHAARPRRADRAPLPAGDAPREVLEAYRLVAPMPAG